MVSDNPEQQKLSQTGSSASTMKKARKQSKAEEMASKQADIGIAEFFAINRHLLGFDNKRKALLTTVKEAVDNSIDACEEADVLPEIHVEIIEMGMDRYRIIIEDNGPGIVKKEIPKIFAKLLYGSKFHSLKQSRGQQGIGISASVMYGQLTTGRPAKITSKVSEEEQAHCYELRVDTKMNKPEIISEEIKPWNKEHGTRIQIDLEGYYHRGAQSVDEYLKETAVVNPHVTIIYTNPKAEQLVFSRVTEKNPVEAKEIKPHPYGIDLGVFMKLIEETDAKTIQQFLTSEFSKVSAKVAKEVCEIARILPSREPSKITHEESEKIVNAFSQVKLQTPSPECLSPITSELMEKGVKKEVNAEFYTSVSRAPAVYKGNPFQIEVALAYGGEQQKDNSIRVMRFANRVPLLFQQGVCAVTKAVTSTNWKSYGLNQSNGALPAGPLTLVVHISSVWVPFTSESKEAMAHYPEIINEVRLAVQEVGRALAKYTGKKVRVNQELKKRGYIKKYMSHVATGLKEILGFDKGDEEKTLQNLEYVLERKRGKIDPMEFDPSKNTEYDENLARIGRDEPAEEDEKASEDASEDTDKTDSRLS